MFSLFKNNSKRDSLNKKYTRLLEEGYKLSKINRSKSDSKYAEAEEVLKLMETLNK